MRQSSTFCPKMIIFSPNSHFEISNSRRIFGLGILHFWWRICASLEVEKVVKMIYEVSTFLEKYVLVWPIALDGLLLHLQPNSSSWGRAGVRKTNLLTIGGERIREMQSFDPSLIQEAGILMAYFRAWFSENSSKSSFMIGSNKIPQRYASKVIKIALLEAHSHWISNLFWPLDCRVNS